MCIGHYSKEDKEKMIEILRRMQEEDQNLGKFICIHKQCTVCDHTCGYGLQAMVPFKRNVASVLASKHLRALE